MKTYIFQNMKGVGWRCGFRSYSLDSAYKQARKWMSLPVYVGEK